MQRRIRKWGNSLAVRIPAEIVRISRLAEGTPVEMAYADGRIVLTVPQSRRNKYDLDELVARMTEENRHRPVDWDGPAGREAW